MEKGQIYEFESGKSFFKAFKVAGDIDLELVSYADDKYLDLSQLFWPSLITLDANFPLRNNYLFVSVKDDNWGGKIDLNENEKYIIIKTNQNTLGDKRISGSSADGSVVTFGGSTSDVLNTSANSFYTTYSAGGIVRV